MKLHYVEVWQTATRPICTEQPLLPGTASPHLPTPGHSLSPAWLHVLSILQETIVLPTPPPQDTVTAVEAGTPE